jgi:hypothetical protein
MQDLVGLGMLKYDCMSLIDRNGMRRYHYSVCFIHLNNMRRYLLGGNLHMSFIMRDHLVMLNWFRFGDQDGFGLNVTLYWSFMIMSLMVNHRMMRNWQLSDIFMRSYRHKLLLTRRFHVY